MKKIVLVLILIIVSFLNSQPLWEQVNPKPLGNHLFSVQMFDSTTIWAFGQSGMMAYSPDYGKNWYSYHQDGLEEDIYDSHFFDAQNGLIFGSDGAIYRTSDQCKSWTKESSTVNAVLRDVDFYDNMAVCVGLEGTIIFSENSGKSWQTLAFPDKSNLYSVDIIKPDHWIVCGDNGLYAQSFDRGKKWAIKTLAKGKKLNFVKFINTQTGFISSVNGWYYTTHNAGLTWTSDSVKLGRDLYKIWFKDQKVGFIAGEGGLIRRTLDGGKTWQNKFSGSVSDFYDVVFYNATHGALVGQAGNFTHAVNGYNRFLTFIDYTGATFKNLNAVASYSTKDVFACGEKAAFILSGSGGHLFHKPSPRTPQAFNNVYFTDSEYGWAVGADGEIRITTDSGKNWMYQASRIKYEDLNAVFFANRNVGWIACENGLILSTEDMGTSWFSTKTDVNTSLNAISFIDEYSGFVAGDSGTFLVTTNGGSFWEQRYFPTNEDLSAIVMKESYGYVTSSSGELYRTFDKGQNWQRVLCNSDIGFNDLATLDKNYSWIAGKNGSVLFSDNHFRDWVNVYSTTRHNLRSIDFYNDTTGYAAGEFGAIIKFKGDRKKMQSMVNRMPGGLLAFDVQIDGNYKIDLKAIDSEKIYTVFNGKLKAGRQQFFMPGQVFKFKQGVYAARVSSAAGTENIYKVLVY